MGPKIYLSNPILYTQSYLYYNSCFIHQIDTKPIKNDTKWKHLFSIKFWTCAIETLPKLRRRISDIEEKDEINSGLLKMSRFSLFYFAVSFILSVFSSFYSILCFYGWFWFHNWRECNKVRGFMLLSFKNESTLKRVKNIFFRTWAANTEALSLIKVTKNFK